MSVVTPIYAFVAKGAHAPGRLRRWGGHADAAAGLAAPSDDAPISPRVVYPAVVAVSLVLWLALIQAVLLAFGLHLVF
jgi:hypothetical protein